ncbi:MAG: hypothetical protein GPJ54_09785, partial [Candidatus Heimdallarchaeota archaeon]|nr:hypothetical protein [Candidatus Heimdallarchaeota archaeon]
AFVLKNVFRIIVTTLNRPAFHDLDIDLSQNEARVLHSIIKMPNYSDQIIHSTIKMKKSTFSSIKTRLKEQDFYRRYFIPNFPKIGFELLMLQHGRLNQFSTYEERMRIAKDLIEGFVEDFHVVSEDNQKYMLSVSQNLTEYSKNQQAFLQLYLQNNFLSKRGMHTVAFPFEISRVWSFMDFESLVADLFGFASEPYDTRKVIPTGPVRVEKLTRAEKKVLAGLVKFPEESDTLIANNIEVSRNTVANAKRKFVSGGIAFPRVVPNLEKIGLKILNFSYRRFNTKLKASERIEAVEKVRQLLAPFLFISNDVDGFITSAHTSMDEYNTINDELNDFYSRNDYLMDEHTVSYQLKIDKIKWIKQFDFLPSTLKIFNFNEDFGTN